MADWSRFRALLAVLDAGSLSGAARATGASQPTLGRQVRALEAELGAELFRRTARGLEPTATARALEPHARAMAEAAARATLAARGHGESLAGTVRITASAVLSHHVLPGILARLRAEAPEIQLELVPSDTSENLLFREADIALRMYRPEQPDLVARRLPDRPLALYAATAWLDRVGRPESREAALAMDVVGLDRSDLMLRAFAGFGMPRRREDFPVRCDHHPTHWELVRAGCGVGAAQVAIGDADPAVERIAVLDDLPLPVLPLWLAAPAALRRVPRVARVWDHLARAFA